MMQATGKVNEKVMKDLDFKFYLCLIDSVSDMRADLISSETLPKLTGELEASLTPMPVEGNENEFRLSILADYGDELYDLEPSSIHQTEEEHMMHDLCMDKVRSVGLDRPLANPNAQPKWFDTYLDGDKKDFAIESFSEHLRKELSK